MTREGALSCRLGSAGPDSTEAIGGRLAASIQPGTVVGLVGPLGSGKTCLARGLAAGLGVDPREVTSPTFVYLVEHDTPHGTLQHADLYRFADLCDSDVEEAIRNIGLSDAIERAHVTVVEWWNYYRGPIPSRLVIVEFVIEKAEHRSIKLVFHGPDASAVAVAFGARSKQE